MKSSVTELSRDIERLSVKLIHVNTQLKTFNDQKETLDIMIQEKTKELEHLKEEKANDILRDLKFGDRFKHESGSIYILAKCDSGVNSYALINMETGNRCFDCSRIEDVFGGVHGEFTKL